LEERENYYHSVESPIYVSRKTNEQRKNIAAPAFSKKYTKLSPGPPTETSEIYYQVLFTIPLAQDGIRPTRYQDKVGLNKGYLRLLFFWDRTFLLHIPQEGAVTRAKLGDRWYGEVSCLLRFLQRRCLVVT